MKRHAYFVFFLFLSTSLLARKRDSTRVPLQFSGSVTVTNNGIALIPTFSLGKPAALFNFSVTKNRFSFEPQLRYNLADRKPWNFIFWARYKLIQQRKFKLAIGAFSSLVFRSTPVISNSNKPEAMTTTRFLIGELLPTYAVAKNTTIGLYYMYTHGLDPTAPTMNLLSFTTAFTKVELGKKFILKASPQVYYLNVQQQQGGFYFNSHFSLFKKGLPLSVSSIVNKAIRSNLNAKDFNWNIGLTYSY